jgi:ubiquinone/menaquinone biosynthesis C-methylase UbiE
MTDMDNVAERYIESCSKDFWQRIFEIELDYLTKHLKGCKDILSVGCGPASIEGELVKQGFSVTGLDLSREALSKAPEGVTAIVGRAEDMLVPSNSFDAVIYIVSLQFMDDYRKAIERSIHALRDNGRIIVMLLNPASEFFKKKFADPGSYVHTLKHTDLKAIEAVIARICYTQSEYYLGIKGEEIFESNDESEAVLYIINGVL